MVQVLHPPHINHIKVVEAIEFKVTASMSLQWHHPLTKFHPNLSTISKIINGDTHTHTTWPFDKPLAFLGCQLKCIAMVMLLRINLST
jgi:hypothetical protein